MNDAITMANHKTENVPEASDWPLVGNDLHPAAREVFVMIGFCMVVSGVLGNILLISVLFKQFIRKRAIHHLFIGNLALADLGTMGYWFPFFVLDLCLGYHPVASETHCRANGFFVGAMFVSSTLFLTIVSFNRYLHVCHAHLYPRVFTLRRTAVICVVIWVAGYLFALPPLWKDVAGSYHYNRKGHTCSFNREGFTYPKALVLVFSTVPIFLIGYWNRAIFRFWRSRRLSLTSRYPHLHTQASSPTDEKSQEAKSKCGWLRWGCLKRGVNLSASERTTDDGIEAAERRRRSQGSDKTDNEFPNVQLEESAHDDVDGPDNAADCRAYSQQTNVDAENANPITPRFAAEEPAHKHSIDSSNDATDCRAASQQTNVDAENANPSIPRFAAEEPAHKNNVDCRAASQQTNVDAKNANPSTPKFAAEDLAHGDDAGRSDKVEDRRAASQQSNVDHADKPDPCISNIAAEDPDHDDADGSNDAAEVIMNENEVELDGGQCSEDSAVFSASSVGTTQDDSASTRSAPYSHMQSLKKRLRRSRNQEVALVRSLHVVFILVFSFFIPYFIIVLVGMVVKLPTEMIPLSIIMLFFNNSVNWIVYGVMNPTFRKDYVQCLRAVAARLCSCLK